ncbi:MAG: FAD-dependent oxidoreductase [Planctomycetaceae bacterium]
MTPRGLLPTFSCLLLVAVAAPSGAFAAIEPKVAIERQAVQPAYDVVVYGGTSGGVAAAVQVSRSGLSVLVIEPSKHIGGLSSGGLGATDIGNKAAIGGISRDFYRRLGKKYGEEEAWTFEPHMAETVFHEMLFEAKVPVVLEERLDLKNGVAKNEDGSIVSITMESGLKIGGKVFIDASYEGDLLAKAGVSYHVGREANAVYGETLNGVQKANSRNHQFVKRVDPYIEPGNPESGVLPGINPGDPGEDGAGDKRVQAYCFRMCTTDVKENQIEWEKPENYDPRRFELMLRNFEAGDHRIPFLVGRMMPNRKTDTNNRHAFSTDNIGMNYDYPDGDHATRAKIVQDHYDYQKGLMWTLANDPRVAPNVREYVHKWKPAKDEFVDNKHWPHQLYVREARRMISDYVMTQHDCQGGKRAEDPVGLAAYTMDSHNVQRHVTADGAVRNEGNVEVGGFSPYPISYRSIVPKRSECGNLLAPVCLSSSHIAFGSIRMEPVFMVLGQSAGSAAALAIAGNVVVQEIDYKRLRERLEQDGQVLEWTGERRGAGVPLQDLKGIVLDDGDARFTGEWVRSASTAGYVGEGYRHDDNRAKGEKSAEFAPKIERAGRYEVRIAHTPNANRAANVPVAVESAEGTVSVTVDQRRAAPNGLHSLGTFRFEPGKPARVTIGNRGTNGYVIVDALQFLPFEEE